MTIEVRFQWRYDGERARVGVNEELLMGQNERSIANFAKMNKENVFS